MIAHSQEARYSEEARQWVHMGSAGFALLLRVLTWPEAALLAATAILFNVVVLPRVGGRRLYRPDDEARGYPAGIVIYPAAVLALLLLFRARLDMAAAAWGVLAFGDGAATLVGRRWRRWPWPWNPEKTVAGTVAFALAGAAGGAALAIWTRPAIAPEPSLGFALLAPAVAAAVSALVETLPVRLDDNISVPAAAAAVLWLASLVSPAALSGAWPAVVGALPWAVALNAVASWLGYRARTVTAAGAIAGAAIGIAMYAAGGLNAWILLFVTFALAAITSRIGLGRKTRLGIAEERRGRRGPGNALANCGVATIAAVAAIATPYPAAAHVALAAALTAGGSDTVASEIGKAFGGPTFLVTTFRRVKPGTPGAVSLEGTAAGLAAAFGLAALAAALGHIRRPTLPVVVVASVVGACVESVLGATAEGPGFVNNDMLNFINTGVAAAVALVLA